MDSEREAKIALRNKLFVTNGPKTFEFDDELPALPVPDLEATLANYLESVSVVATKEEYEKTEIIVNNFKNGVGQQLQELLHERAKEKRNWVSDLYVAALLILPFFFVSARA